MDADDLRNRFMFHERSRTDNAAAHDHVRRLCLAAAQDLDELLPDGREKSIVMTHLEDVMMWSNASIARRLP